MSRLKECFEALSASGRRALVPYVVAGDPPGVDTVELLCTLADAGADVLELGVPFSDPMSEGPVIQRAHERALDAGVRLRGVLETVRAFRARFVGRFLFGRIAYTSGAAPDNNTGVIVED